MKIRQMNMVTLLAGIWLVLTGITGFWVHIPQCLTLVGLQLLSIRYLPMTTYILYFAIGIFAIITVLVKKSLILKIVALLVALSGMAKITAFVCYMAAISPYAKQLYLPTYLLQIGNPLYHVLLALLAILICANTFRPFIRPKSAIIIASVTIGLGLLISVLPDVLSGFTHLSILHFLLNTVITSLLYACLLIACVYELCGDKVTSRSSELLGN